MNAGMSGIDSEVVGGFFKTIFIDVCFTGNVKAYSSFESYIAIDVNADEVKL